MTTNDDYPESGVPPTILESSTPANHSALPRTILDTGGGTILEDGAYSVSSDDFLPEETFNEFRAIRRLSFSSGEAEVFLTQHPETEEKCVVKLYYHIDRRPEADVLRKLSEMDSAHVPRFGGSGTSRNGRFFELWEYIPGGSLRDLLSGGIPEEQEAYAIVTEILEALEHLATHGISHRDLKPENILVKRRDPLDLVLVDFGIARLTSGHLHKTKLQETPLYSPPEGGKFTHRNRDWWSLGILVIQIRTGSHPWEDLDNDQIHLNKNTLPSPIPEEMGSRWQTLAKGLLTRDPEKRWSSGEVRRWLDGENDIPVHFEADYSRPDDRPVLIYYKRNLRFRSLSEVCALLATPDWEENEHFLDRYREAIRDWMHQLGKTETSDIFHRILQDSELSPCGRVAALIWLFDENDDMDLRTGGTLCLGGVPVEPDDLHLFLSAPEKISLTTETGRKFLGSSIGNWQKKLCGNTWWNQAMRRREELLALIPRLNLGNHVNRGIMEEYSLLPTSVLTGKALEIKRSTVFSPIDTFNRILRLPDHTLTDQDAWLLTCAHPHLLLNSKAETKHQLERRFKILLPVIQAFQARSLNSEFILRPPLHLFIFCLSACVFSIIWASIDGSLQIWSLLALLWLLVFPLSGYFVLGRMHRKMRGLLNVEDGASLPDSDREWNRLIAGTNAGAALVLGKKFDTHAEARAEWESITTDARNINAGLPPSDHIRIPGIPPPHRLSLPVAFQSILVIALLTPPSLQTRAWSFYLEKAHGRPSVTATSPQAPQAPKSKPFIQDDAPPPPQAPASPKRPEAAPPPSAESLKAFVREWVAAENSHDLDRIMMHYADRVSYWNRGSIPRSEVRTARSEYFALWPHTSETITDFTTIRQEQSSYWTLIYQTRFEVFQPSSGKGIEGTQETTLSVGFLNGRPIIHSVKGKVLQKKITSPPAITSPQAIPPSPAITSRPPPQKDFAGETYPETRSIRLTHADASRLSNDQIRHAINEMFARHGADFGKETIKNQFRRFPWYTPRSGVSFEQIESRDFSDIERTNLKLLGSVRDERAKPKTPSKPPPAVLPPARADLPFHQGTWVMRKRNENVKDIDYIENSLRIKGNQFTYSLKVKCVLRPGAEPWGNPRLRNLRSFTGETLFTGTIVRVGDSDFEARVDKVEWPDRGAARDERADATDRRQVGKTWRYTYSNGLLLDARDTSTIFRRP